jgi:hypothetical protein
MKNSPISEAPNHWGRSMRVHRFHMRVTTLEALLQTHLDMPLLIEARGHVVVALCVCHMAIRQ